MTFSLVIGTYNPNKEWLAEALKSAEGLFDEIILVDDGSDDFPLSLVPDDDNFVRHTKNLGFYEARNSGINSATGDWIISLDDDDTLIPENVKELIGHIRAGAIGNAEIISFPIIEFGERIGMVMINPNPKNILENNQFVSGSWFKKSVWEDLHGFQVKTAEDWDFWARAIKSNKEFIYFPKPIYNHRVRGDSLSGAWVGDKFNEIRNDVITNYNLWQQKEVQ